MKAVHKIGCILLALCFAVGLLAGCGTTKTGTSSAPAASGASSGGLKEVTWVSPAALASLDFCWIYVADGLGYFKDEGLKVKIVELTDGSDAKYLAAGKADFSGTSPAVALSTIGAGANNISAVCNIVVNNIFGIAVSPKSGIKSWADLKGKTVATAADSYPSLFNPILSAAGVDPANVKYVNFGTAEYEALKSGQADGMGTWTSEFYMCKGMGYSDWTYLNGNDVLPQIANSIWTNNDFAQKNPDAVKGFVRAITKAVYFSYLNPEAAADITLRKFPEIKVTWDGAVGAVKGNVIGMMGATDADQKARADGHKIGTYDMSTVQTTIDNLKKGGVITADLKADTYYTNKYIDSGWDYSKVQGDSKNYTFDSKLYKDNHK